MPQKTESKTEFAKRCGVSQPALTRACKAKLLPAMVGKRIDVDHPAAVAYAEKQACDQTPGAATGLDSRYEEAVASCRATGRWSASSLRRELGIGYNRAAKLIGMIELAGLAPVPGQEPEAGKPATPDRSHTPALAVPPAGQQPLDDPPPVHEIPKDVARFMDWTLRDIVTQYGTMTAFNDFLKATKTVADIVEKDLKNAKSRGELVSRHVVKVGVIDPIEAAHINLLTDGAKSMATRSAALLAAGKTADELETYLAKAIGKFIKPVKNKVKRAMANA